ncbi:B-cell receptor CD22-like [Ptychodera flava]|uniref:B-cell receptor CD22-like n=1 Tax=Ptychodera flava TaxID=63121 RepID=UPI00396A0FB3
MTDPPDASILASNNTVIEGDTYNRSCSVDANPNATVKWTHRGSHVGNSEVLDLQNVQRDQNGTYTCQATNTFWDGSSGNDTDTFQLDVQYPPDVSILAAGNAVIEGDTYNRSCSVDANPKATLRWIHQGSNVGNSEVLHLKNVQRDQNGTYTCQATNTFWDGGSGNDTDTFELDVQYPPDVSILAAGNAVIEGDTYNRSCSVDAKPKATLRWIHQGSNVGNSEVLHLKNVKRDQNGTYTCQATNTFLDGSSGNGTDTFELDVQYLHEMSIFNENDGKVIEGKTYYANCSADSNPTADISWLTPDGGQTLGEELQLEHASRTDSGDYRCTATVTYWDETEVSNKKTATVDVQFEPTVRRSHYSDVVEADIGENATLICVMSANPAPTFIWQKNGQYITNSSKETTEETETTSTLTVAYITNADYGDYISTATNNVSEDQCKIKLNSSAIIGIVFGLLIVIGVAAALGYYFRIYRRRKNLPERTEEQETSSGSELTHIGKDNDEDRGNYQDLLFAESKTESNYTSLESQYTSLRQPDTDTADIYMKLGARSNDFPREHIEMQRIIGTGSYGQVLRATATEIAGERGKTVVAVKTVKEPIYVITEFMGQGNLLKYLRDYRREKTSDYANSARLKWDLKSKDIVSFGRQIATGMQYLASKSFVHGELAAKTVLLSKDRRTCKLSNIGLRGDEDIEAIRIKEVLIEVKKACADTPDYKKTANEKCYETY